MGMFPAEGVLLPPQENTTVTNPPPGPGQEWAIARWNQAVAQDRAWRANQLRLDKYMREAVESRWWTSYDAGRLPYTQGPEPVPGELWVGSDYYAGQFVQFTQVETANPLCQFIEDGSGWVINGQFYKRQPKPQHSTTAIKDTHKELYIPVTLADEPVTASVRRVVSPAAKKRMAAAQRKRWSIKKKGGKAE